MNTSELFETLRELSGKARLDPGLKITVNVNLTGADPAQWVVRAGNCQLTLDQGEAPEADVAVTAAWETAVGIFEKTEDPMKAFLTGKIKLKGDIGKIAMLKQLIPKKKS